MPEYMTPAYAQKFKAGIAFQDYAIRILYELGLPIVSYSSMKYQFEIGDSACIEFKLDQRYRQTGNIYIETHEKTNASNADYVPSGILRDDSAWLWAIGNEDKFYLVGKRHLLMAYKTGKYKEVSTPTSRGFLIPVEQMENYSIKTIERKT